MILTAFCLEYFLCRFLTEKVTVSTLYDFVSGRHWPPGTHWTSRGRRGEGKVKGECEIMSQLSCVKNIYTTIF